MTSFQINLGSLGVQWLGLCQKQVTICFCNTVLLWSSRSVKHHLTLYQHGAERIMTTFLFLGEKKKKSPTEVAGGYSWDHLTFEIILSFFIDACNHTILPYGVQSKYKLWFHSADEAKGNDWHTMSRLRDKRQKQSMAVNSVAVRLCALRGSCRLPYLKGVARIASLKSKLPIVPGERGISQLVNGPDREGYTGQSDALVLSIHGRRTDNGESIEHLVMLCLLLGWVTFEPAVCPDINTIWWSQCSASDLCKNNIISACLFGNTWMT